jgi:hypothetical protein
MIAAHFVRVLLLLLIAVGLSGCWRTEAEYQKLVEENQYLKSEVERLNRRGAEEKAEISSKTPGDAPDMSLTIVDLWSQRFDDINDFRAKQRLSNKTLRITGAVDGVAADAIGLVGVSKRFGNIRMAINLTPGYALRIRDGLAALEPGTVVTVQGKFLYERMILTDATIVDQTSGRALYSDDLLSLSAGIPISKAQPNPPPKLPK